MILSHQGLQLTNMNYISRAYNLGCLITCRITHLKTTKTFYALLGTYLVLLEVHALIKMLLTVPAKKRLIEGLIRRFIRNLLIKQWTFTISRFKINSSGQICPLEFNVYQLKAIKRELSPFLMHLSQPWASLIEIILGLLCKMILEYL